MIDFSKDIWCDEFEEDITFSIQRCSVCRESERVCMLLPHTHVDICEECLAKSTQAIYHAKAIIKEDITNTISTIQEK